MIDDAIYPLVPNLVCVMLWESFETQRDVEGERREVRVFRGDIVDINKRMRYGIYFRYDESLPYWSLDWT